MRALFIFLSSILLYSCYQKNEGKKNTIESEIDKQTLKTTEQIQKSVKIDTTSFEYFLQLSDNIIEEIPKYHNDKFLGNQWDDENDPYRKIFSEDTDHFQLYENFIATFSVSIYGVISETILASFTSEGRMIDDILVASSSDMDLSSTTYSDRSFNIFSDSLVQVLDKKTQAKKYKNFMPDSIVLFDLDSTEVIETLDYHYFVINRTGSFQEVFPIRPVLQKQKLKNLTKQELRIKRNEFFARLGYAFRSPDLTEHFEKFIWYEPKYEDVTDRLTAFDIYNIKLIRDIEEKE